MIEVIAEVRTVWRATNRHKRRSRLTKGQAYRDAALSAVLEKLPCTCEAFDFETGIGGQCEAHEHMSEGRKAKNRTNALIGRLARWLMWRDRRRAQLELGLVMRAAP